MNAGQPLVWSSSRNPVGRAIRELGVELLRREDIYSDWLAGKRESRKAEREQDVISSSENKNVEPRLSEKEFLNDSEGAERVQNLKRELHEKLLKEVDLSALRSGGNRISSREMREEVRQVLEKLVATVQVPGGAQGESRDLRARLVLEVLDDVLGYGPLEPFLRDPSVTEVMVKDSRHIYVERHGKLFKTSAHFSDVDQLMTVIERIVSPIGRRVDESSPLCDARLPDGSRVNVVIPPLALDGPAVTIRKFSEKKLSIEDLMKRGALTAFMGGFLKICVRLRKNIVVSGGTGTGKTTLLNVLSSFIPHDERIVTLEDSAELRLQQEHVVRLESRPPNIEGGGEIPIRRLLVNALRMRPDRIVVGECRGGEALDMLQAMNTGHDGSLTTLHANSPRDALSRLETLVLMAGLDLPVRAIREQIRAAVQMVVQLSRFSDGTRRITSITEVTGMEGEVITLQDLFRFRQTGMGKEGSVEGVFEPTGLVPTFFDEMKAKGITFSMEMFKK